MSAARSLLRNKSLLRVSGKEALPETFISFHSSGLTCNQWRKLKNLWFPGRTLYRPSFHGEKGDQFLAQFGKSGGPTCLAYFPDGASDKIQSMEQDLLLLYGQYGSAFVDHKDMQKAASLAGTEGSLFDFCLPSSYLSFLCSPNESKLPPAAAEDHTSANQQVN